MSNNPEYYNFLGDAQYTEYPEFRAEVIKLRAQLEESLAPLEEESKQPFEFDDMSHRIELREQRHQLCEQFAKEVDALKQKFQLPVLKPLAVAVKETGIAVYHPNKDANPWQETYDGVVRKFDEDHFCVELTHRFLVPKDKLSNWIGYPYSHNLWESYIPGESKPPKPVAPFMRPIHETIIPEEILSDQEPESCIK